MEFVAFIGKDEENWGQIKAVMNRLEDCEKVILVKDKKTSGFPTSPKTRIVNVDSETSLLELKEEIMKKVRIELKGNFESAVSLASGNGKEHMALISALLTIPVGIRLVVYTKEGVKFIN